MEALVALVAAGELDPVIDRVYPLREAAAADEHLDVAGAVRPRHPERRGLGRAQAGYCGCP